MLRVSSMVRNAKTPGSRPLGLFSVAVPYRPSIGGMNERLPVAMISWS